MLIRQLYLARLVAKGTAEALLECQRDNQRQARQLAVLKAEVRRLTGRSPWARTG
jgi:hypothetical protein